MQFCARAGIYIIMKRSCAKRRRRLFKILFVNVIVIAVIFVYGRLCVNPILEEVSQEEMRMLTMTAINNAVLECMDMTPEYTEMVSFMYDDEKNIKSIAIKATTVNKLVQTSVKLTQEKLAEIGMKGIDIPVGSLSGVTFLSGKGPSVNLKVYPVGSVSAELKTEFTECGINQTFHKIYIRINANTSIIIPGANNVINSLSDVLIFNSIIVGKIPSTYLHATSVQDMLDLIP